MDTRLGRPLVGHRVHFVGIGGVGMAALAELLLAMGYEISGSDLKASRTTRRLLDLGAEVHVGAHRRENVEGAEHVIVSAAIPRDNPEVAAASGAEVLSRAQLLGRIFRAGRGIAVTGTHGKTTTSSMLAHILQGSDVSFVIGGDLNDIGSGARLGSSDIVVAEADEAYGSFLELEPELAVVTSIDLDHLDHYADQDAIDDAFVTFLSQRKGAAVLCASDEGIGRVRDRITDPVVTYALDGDADLVVASDRSVHWQGTTLGTLELSVPGAHNVLNAAGAIAAAITLGSDPELAVRSMSTFSGVERRFSVRGVADDVVVVDDYSHLPRKVEAAIDSAREVYPDRRVVLLFQPHLYSRTQQMAGAFGDALARADVVVVTDVYGAREDPIPGVSGRLVSDAVRDHADVVAVYLPRLEEAAGFVAGLAQPGDVVLTVGAGDVTTAAPRILRLLEDRS